MQQRQGLSVLARAARAALLLLAAVVFAGCSNSLTGRWASTSIDVPEFGEINKNVVTFRGDGSTTSMWMNQEEKIQYTHGRFAANEESITIYPENEKPPYELLYHLEGNRLSLTNQQGTIYYERAD